MIMNTSIDCACIKFRDSSSLSRSQYIPTTVFFDVSRPSSYSDLFRACSLWLTRSASLDNCISISFDDYYIDNGSGSRAFELSVYDKEGYFISSQRFLVYDIHSFTSFASFLVSSSVVYPNARFSVSIS